MKYKIIYYSWFFLIFLIHFSCKKEKMPPVVDTWKEDHGFWGESKALRNGELRNFECSTLKNPDFSNKFSILLSYFDEFRQLRGEFNFRHCPYLVGKYYPTDYEFAFGTPSDSLFTIFYSSIQGDIAGDTYISKSDSSVVFNLEKYDISTGEIWGSYSAELVKDTSLFGELDKSSPFELKFESGTFHAKVE
jgi:hypothetical protein